MRQFARQMKTKQSNDMSIPQFYIPGFKKFINRTQVKVKKVPVRLNGLTSSGTCGRCYYNVDNLVELFGGKTVIGWCVSHVIDEIHTNRSREFLHTIVLHSHAVWMNDEGKLSDPTAKSWMPDGIFDEKSAPISGLSEENGKIYTKFIPLTTSSGDDNMGCNTINIAFSTDINGRIISEYKISVVFTQNGNIEVPLTWKNINAAMIDDIILYSYDWTEHFRTSDDFHAFRRKEGNFNEKSLVTGKTIHEIRKDRLMRTAAL